MNNICWFEKFGFVVVLAGLLTCGVAKGASTVLLQWTPNTDPSVSGYNVYYGNQSRNYTNSFSVGNMTNAAVHGLVEGQNYFFAVTAYDDIGDESDYSDESVYVVPGFLTLTPGANPGDPLRLQFPVASGRWYELQTSNDLRSWSTIWQVTGVQNNWVEFDAPTTTGKSQFFRLVLH